MTQRSAVSLLFLGAVLLSDVIHSHFHRHIHGSDEGTVLCRAQDGPRYHCARECPFCVFVSQFASSAIAEERYCPTEDEARTEAVPVVTGFQRELEVLSCRSPPSS